MSAASKKRVRLSVLDLSPVPSGADATRAVRNTLDLARHAEALGCTRYWLAEHHNAGALASSSPEILIAAVAGATTRIRVGSGGIMLPNHSPLKVAESFRLLGALHPGRVDLGVGRAAGTDPKTALALRQAKELLGAEDFPAQLDALLGHLAHEADPALAFAPVKAVPIGVPAPPVFLLGSGTDSARLAASLGLGYAFAHHIAGTGEVEAMRAYREAFRPSAWSARMHPEGRAEPWAILAVNVLCAADETSLDDLERCADLSMLRFGQGLRDLPFPSIEEARAYGFDADEEVFRASGRGGRIAGDEARVRDRMARLVAETGADEVLATTTIHDADERKRSYDRLFRALG